MEEKRKGEIALALIKYIGKKEPVYLKKDYSEISNEIGVPEEELKEFYKSTIVEIINEQ